MIAERSPAIGNKVASPYAVPLGSGPKPAQLIARLDPQDRPAVLWGDWFGRGVVILRSPLSSVSATTAGDVITLLDVQPSIAGWTPDDHPEDGALIGGGWLGCLGFAGNSSSACFYDSLLRWRSATGYTFETLGLCGREEHVAAELATWRRLLRTAVDSVTPPLIIAAGFTTISPPAIAQLRHLASVEAAIGKINSGDFYQINLCTRLLSRSTASPPALFARLAEQLDPAFGALLVTEPGDDLRGTSPQAVVSVSPELFLRVRRRTLTTSPIKGTAPRRPGETDAPGLRASAKDAAENIMIVDLMRNDLSQVCRPGTVQVEDLLDLQAHPGVWHLVSTVAGQLADEVTTSQLLSVAFPPGSVTGAPKSSALQGITELEPCGRGAYTGALGLTSPLAGADFNVLIRTLECTGDRIELGVGGGITVDSAPIAEWYECLAKAAPLVSALGSELDPELRVSPPPPSDRQLTTGLLETMLAVGPSVLRLGAHLARLDRSCRELYGQGVPGDLAGRITNVVSAGPTPPPRRVVRVMVRPQNCRLRIDVSVARVGIRVRASTLSCAVRSPSCWRHKWADRDEFTLAERKTAPDLPYFLTPADVGPFVAESSRGNLFCLIDGTWLTPPLDENVLPGVTRRAVLDILVGARLPLRIDRFAGSQLQRSAGAFWTSGVNGAVPISAVDGHRLPASEELVRMLNAHLGSG